MERAKRRHRKLLWLAGIGILGLVVTVQANASSIDLLSEDRFVSVSNIAPASYALISGVTVTNPPASSFNNAWLKLQGSIPWLQVGGFKPEPTSSGATQDVSVSSTGISLSSALAVNAGGDPLGLHLPAGATGTARAESYFEVTFSVEQPTSFFYEFEVSPSAILDTAEMVLESWSFGSQILAETAGVPEIGLLDPDTYTLRVHLVGLASGDLAGSATSDMTFGVLPEPATALLLGVGVAALAGLRSSSRRPSAARD